MLLLYDGRQDLFFFTWFQTDNASFYILAAIKLYVRRMLIEFTFKYKVEENYLRF